MPETPSAINISLCSVCKLPARTNDAELPVEILACGCLHHKECIDTYCEHANIDRQAFQCRKCKEFADYMVKVKRGLQKSPPDHGGLSSGSTQEQATQPQDRSRAEAILCNWDYCVACSAFTTEICCPLWLSEQHAELSQHCLSPLLVV